MSVNIYKTEFGLFSVIADDVALSNLRSLSTGNIFDNNGITALGNSLITGVPLSATYNTIMANDVNFNPDPYNNITSIAPNTVIKQLSGVTTEDQFVYYTLKDEKQVRNIFRYYQKPQDLRAQSCLYTGPNILYLTSNSCCPYGVFKTSKGGDRENHIFLGILVSSSDMTDFDFLEIRFYDKTGVMNHGSTNKNTFLRDYFNGVDPIHIDTDSDPFYPGGSSGDDDTGGTGGTGDFDGASDNVDIPSLPTLSATDTGFITIFNPSLEQLKSLANYMWSSAFDLNTFKKLFADPMDCVLGLSIVPVVVPNGGNRNVSVGNISTGISMTTAASQYVSVDCGTLNVNEFWGAYLDYAPYTKAEIYLPYIGTHPISVDDIMGKAVHVVYHVDILSGACTAFVKCGGSVLYEFIGQCASSIPITGNDWTNVINGVISIAGAIGSMVATGGASAPMAAEMIASTAVNNMKPNVEKSGSMSGTGGMLAVQTPYLILTRPRQALPSNQNTFSGYPSYITRTMSSLSGYTEIDSVHLEGISATDDELSEIENLLKTGVIF